MNDNTNGRTSGTRDGRRRAGMLAVAAAAAVLLAACGGSSPSNAPQDSTTADYQHLLAYSECMRSHGDPDFPDPTHGPNGGWALEVTGPSAQRTMNSPISTAAAQACQKLRPGGNHLTQAQLQARTAQLLKVSVCMRAHGITNFPDPDPTTRLGFNIPPSLDIYTPQFQAAEKACLPLMPANERQEVSRLTGGGS
jgi:hypothetical protein